MKKILIVNKSFDIGGIQASLVNMIKVLQHDFDVELMIFYNKGMFKDKIPPNIKIHLPSKLMRLRGMGLNDAKKEGIFIYSIRAFIALFDKIFTNRLSIWISLIFQKKLTGYDIAISYHHEPYYKNSVAGFYRFVNKKVDAKVKLGWIHYDPENVLFNDDKNIKYIKKMDKVMLVSRSLCKKYEIRHPELAGKLDYCYNFIDVDYILNQSFLVQDYVYPNNKIVFFSACRLSKEKAIIRALETFESIFISNTKLLWFIAGDGDERENIEKKIKQLRLDNQVILLGNISNPYPYMKNSHALLSLSYHEAAPMVFLEAKLLGVPIFATETSSTFELLDDYELARICRNSSEDMREAFLDFTGEIDEYTKKRMNYKSNINNYDSLMKIKSFI